MPDYFLTPSVIKVLGRQELNSFVKQMKQKGHIEIELKGRPGKPNIVIRRELVEGTRTTSFTINGKSAVGKDVNATIANLNIQVGNLWCVTDIAVYRPSLLTYSQHFPSSGPCCRICSHDTAESAKRNAARCRKRESHNMARIPDQVWSRVEGARDGKCTTWLLPLI